MGDFLEKLSCFENQLKLDIGQLADFNSQIGASKIGALSLLQIVTRSTKPRSIGNYT
jgi:hypothetical protein